MCLNVLLKCTLKQSVFFISFSKGFWVLTVWLLRNQNEHIANLRFRFSLLFLWSKCLKYKYVGLKHSL